MSGETDSVELDSYELIGGSEQIDSPEPINGSELGESSKQVVEGVVKEKVDTCSGAVSMEDIPVVAIIEAALLAAGKPLSLEQLAKLFDDDARPDKPALKQAMAELGERCADRGYELKEVASGWRFQVRQQLAHWVGRLWDEKPQRYTRALLETMALIAYRQPITRGEIEDIRGVSVSTNIIRTLQEREWVRVVGHRDVPGRPAMYATTRQFLDYFNLRNLDELPTLSELRDLDEMAKKLEGSYEGNANQPELALEGQGEHDLVNSRPDAGESGEEAGDNGNDNKGEGKEWNASRLVSVEEAQAFQEEGDETIETLFSELDDMESGLTLTYNDYDPRLEPSANEKEPSVAETEQSSETGNSNRSEPGVGPDPDAG